MKDTQPNVQAPVDPEVAATLQSNPEAAHFVASLAQGASLAEAVRDHFGNLIADEPHSDPQPAEPAAAAPTPAAPAPKPDVAMYQSQLQSAPADDDIAAADDDDDLFLFSSVSVWD